jgi:hypothetical protein
MQLFVYDASDYTEYTMILRFRILRLELMSKKQIGSISTA